MGVKKSIECLEIAHGRLPAAGRGGTGGGEEKKKKGYGKSKVGTVFILLVL
jgi:hypothetical protein